MLVSGPQLSVSPSKLCEAVSDHCGAQKDIRKSGNQHLCEFMKYFVKDVLYFQVGLLISTTCKMVPKRRQKKGQLSVKNEQSARVISIATHLQQWVKSALLNLINI